MRPLLNLVVLGSAFEQIDRMIQDRLDHFKTFAHGFRRAGKVYDQSSRSNAADTARDHRHRSLVESLDTHCFGETRRFTFNRLQSRFGSVVAVTKTRAASGHD